MCGFEEERALHAIRVTPSEINVPAVGRVHGLRVLVQRSIDSTAQAVLRFSQDYSDCIKDSAIGSLHPVPQESQGSATV